MSQVSRPISYAVLISFILEVNMKKLPIISFLSIIVFVQPAAAKSSGKDITTLFKVKIEGTTIDTMPDHIDVIVANPNGQYAYFLEKRRIFKTQLPNTISLYGVSITFFKPSDYPDHKVGDIVYQFFLESEKDFNEFIKRYNLKVHAIRTNKQIGKYTEYVSQPGYYVILHVKTIAYICKTHPEIFNKKPGKCKKCGSDLTQEVIYRIK